MNEAGEKRPSWKHQLKQVFKFLLFLGLGLFIIWYFQRSLTPEEKQLTSQALWNANWWMVGLLIVFGVLSNAFRTWRWRLLIQPMGYTPRFFNTFMSVGVAYFANLAFPRLGEVMRCTFMQRYEKVPFQKSLGTVVTERALDIICFLLIFLASFWVEYRKLKDYVGGMFAKRASSGGASGGGVNAGSIVLWSLVALAVAAAAVIVLLVVYYRRHKDTLPETHFLCRIAKILNGFGEGIMSLKHIRYPWRFVLHTLGIWACYWIMMVLAIHSISGLENTGAGLAMICLAMGTIGQMVTPSGIGLYPVIISETVAIFGFSKLLGYSAGWIAWGTQTIVIILSGLLSLILFPIINKK